LRNYVGGQQRTWVKWLYLGEHCYNTTHNIPIGMTSFRGLYGYGPPSFIEARFGDSMAPRSKD
jgi:hypothetical protein